MTDEFFVAALDLGFIATGPRDAGRELIGHDGTGNAFEILEVAHVARDPVGDLLGWRSRYGTRPRVWAF